MRYLCDKKQPLAQNKDETPNVRAVPTSVPPPVSSSLLQLPLTNPPHTRRDLFSQISAFKDNEENDTFWQRWDAFSDPDPSKLSSTLLNPVVMPNLCGKTQPPVQNKDETSSISSFPASDLALVSASLSQLSITNRPHAKIEFTKQSACLPNQDLAALVSKLTICKLPSNNSRSSHTPIPKSCPDLSKSLTAPTSSSKPSIPNSYEDKLLPSLDTLIDILLRLALYVVLLFVAREELRLGPAEPGDSYKGVLLSNGTMGRRPTLIEPERLKDFGEEELLNGDVKVPDTRVVVEAPVITLKDPPKTRRVSEFRIVPRPAVQYLRFEDISAAAFTIQSGIQKTPCTYSRLSKQYGMEIYLKKEHLHYTGSVKERGVLYLVSSLTQEQQRKGVIVATDCNFSMAVAHHAVELKIPVFAIMPSSCTSPRLRIYRDYGAMVISYGSTGRDSQNHARHLANDNGYLYLEEDESAIYLAGLGTVGMEIYEQVSKLDAVVVPAAGQYGLLAGTAAAIKHLNSHILVIGIEPEGFPLLLQSLKTDGPIKDIHSNPNIKLYGDLMECSLGLNTYQLAKKLVDKVISVSEEDSLVAMLRFQEFERSTVDTEGAMGLAAILAGQLPELKGKRVAVVVSSANMELDLVRQCLDRALVLEDRVSKFSVQLGEWPGDMAKLLDVLSREDVRLLDVSHRRHSDKSDLFRAKVECVVETRDKTQSVQLRKTLSERYPSLCWLER
ncbi:L-threonine ammonia-lyase isoform X1 [Phycodurus eques]|uniref:L-threonine ammonia-lyase isoform X1 n=2 Tax=Phycodurus eques TaxID=693459 RepID=UPI002ACD35E2|nr:L-threonine ammonia-lyase isoform X1 [Phycodurus eques]